MNFTKILTFAIIVMFLVTPFAGAKQEVADSAKQDKKIDEKVTGKTKEVAKEITSKDKDIKGKVTVTDSESGKYTVEKKSKTEISISKDEVKGEHTKSKVTFAKEDLQKIDVDGDQLYGVLHISEDGSTTHDVYTESQLTSGAEMIFSENIVNGYTGYYEKTQTGVTSGTIIDIPDVSGSDYYITASVDGSVPAYSPVNKSLKTSFPDSANLLGYWDFSNVSGNYISSNYGGPKALITNGTVSGRYCTFAGNGNIANPFALPSAGHSVAVQFRTSSTAGANNHLAWLWPNSAIIRYRPDTDALATYNGSSYKLNTINLNDNRWHIVINTNKVGARMKTYSDGALVTNSSSTTTYTTLGGFFAANYMGNGEFFTGDIARILVYKNEQSLANVLTVMFGGSGISFRPSPSMNYTGYDVASSVENIIDTDATCTGLEYVDTTGGTHTVTVRIYFTEDITKTTETKGAVYQNVSIIHTKQNATASVGTIAYELDPLYSGTPVLASNNTNATISRNDTHVLISTGLVKQGQSFSYAVSVPDNHDHGFHIGDLMKWVGTGWDFVNTAPEDWTNYIGDQIEVTVS